MRLTRRTDWDALAGVGRIVSDQAYIHGDIEYSTMTDLTPAMIRAARELLGWNVEQLAEAAGVSPSTVNRFQYARDERSVGVSFGNVQRLRLALEEAGIRFSSTSQSVTIKLLRSRQDPTAP